MTIRSRDRRPRQRLSRAWVLWTAVLTAGALAGPEPRVLLRGAAGGAVPAFEQAERAGERRRMVNTQITARGLRDREVVDAMRRVPRHRFVPEEVREQAYADSALPIAADQTISQPFVVAYMAAVLEIEPDDRVLEIGTGSAYHAAILGQLAGHVVTIEIIHRLARMAAQRLEAMGYGNITVLEGDGYGGWPPGAPYDAILATAAPAEVPQPLIDQLRAGGRMVIPVGANSARQELLLIEKDAEGDVSRRALMAVRFVPLTRERQ